MPKASSDKIMFYGTGRRKSSIARVRLVPGTGKITINSKDIDEYLGLETLKVIVRQPLVTTDTLNKYDVLCTVKGGGISGQATEIKIHADHMIRTREKLNKLLSEKTGQPIEVIERDTERDHYMTAQEALKYGLIDGIMDKRM